MAGACVGQWQPPGWQTHSLTALPGSGATLPEGADANGRVQHGRVLTPCPREQYIVVAASARSSNELVRGVRQNSPALCRPTVRATHHNKAVPSGVHAATSSPARRVEQASQRRMYREPPGRGVPNPNSHRVAVRRARRRRRRRDRFVSDAEQRNPAGSASLSTSPEVVPR